MFFFTEAGRILEGGGGLFERGGSLKEGIGRIITVFKHVSWKCLLSTIKSLFQAISSYERSYF